MWADGRSLYIDHRGARIEVQGRRIVVRAAGNILASAPARRLDQIVLFSLAELNTSALGALREHGVGLMALHPTRPGRCVSIISSAHGNVGRRLRQYRLQDDAGARARIASDLVRRKLRSQRITLQRLLDADSGPAFRTIRHCVGTLDRTLDGLEGAAELGRLRGLEGSGARAYFAGLVALAPPSLKFRGRNRRPPRDPLNAVLSLSYTLAHGEAIKAALACGLDPWLGTLHEVSYSRESLACDLTEPLRPIIDRWAIELFRSQWLRADHFGASGSAVLLAKNGRRKFFSAHGAQVPRWRRRLLAGARWMARNVDSAL